MEVVKVGRFDLKDAKRAYEAGKLFGAFEAYRQIRPDAIPHEAQPINAWLTPVHFRYAYNKGQEDSIENRNLFAMFEYKTVELVVVEIGCKHDYDTTGSRMCLSVGKCRKCGHKFLCDSSG